MASRKALIVTYHFPPSAAVAVHRMLGLVRYLPALGWETIVVAPPHVADEPADPGLLRLVPARTNVIRVPFPHGILGGAVGRLAPLARWLPGGLRACQRVIRQYRPDVLYTSSPPGCVHYLGLYLKRRFGLPWAACLRDPWITNRRIDQPMPHWQKWDIPWEARVMRSADAIIANTPLGLEGLQAAYPDCANKMVSIPNGFDPENFPASSPPVALRSRLTLLHAGELYGGRDPRPLLDALADLEAQPNGSTERPHFRVEFLGRCTEAIYDLAGEIERRRLSASIQITDQVPYRQAVDKMLAADILLLIHSRGMRVGVPAKLYEYLGARRPILALAEPESDIARVLRASSVLHRLAPPHDAVQIRQALAELAAEIRAGKPVVAEPSQLWRFTRQHMAEKVAACLNQCLAHQMARKEACWNFQGRIESEAHSGAAPGGAWCM